MRIKRSYLYIFGFVSLGAMIYLSVLNLTSNNTSSTILKNKPIFKLDTNDYTNSLTVQAGINRYINNNSVMIFSKSYCPHSKRVKTLFDNLIRNKYKVLELDQLDMNTMNKYQDTLQSITGARSVPRVFIDGRFVGGADDTVRKHQSGELNQLLIDANVIS